MRWRVVLEHAAMIAACGGWGHLMNHIGEWAFPPRDQMFGYMAFVLVSCFGGGMLLGKLWAWLTWPARRRELMKQWGIKDPEE